MNYLYSSSINYTSLKSINKHDPSTYSMVDTSSATSSVQMAGDSLNDNSSYNTAILTPIIKKGINNNQFNQVRIITNEVY